MKNRDHGSRMRRAEDSLISFPPAVSKEKNHIARTVLRGRRGVAGRSESIAARSRRLLGRAPRSCLDTERQRSDQAPGGYFETRRRGKLPGRERELAPPRCESRVSTRLASGSAGSLAAAKEASRLTLSRSPSRIFRTAMTSTGPSVARQVKETLACEMSSRNRRRPGASPATRW